MSCDMSEETLAWLEGGDSELPAEVARHLEACEGCRKTLVALRETRDGLSRLTDDVPTDALESVRSTVLETIAFAGSSQSRPRRFTIYVAAAALLLAFSVVFIRARSTLLSVSDAPSAPRRAAAPGGAEDRDRPEIAAARGSQTRGESGSEPLEPAASVAPSPRSRSASLAVTSDREPAREVITLKLMTDDPEIVILWLID